LTLAAQRSPTVLAITGDSEAAPDRFLATARDFPVPVALDPEARVPLLLGVRVIPGLVLLDGQGPVASKIEHSP
jgi:hypothetical protein